MKFKLDENLGSRIQALFKNKGFAVETVLDQNLQGCTDQHLYEVCCNENRCLVTLDLDFADITRFSPTKCNGIVVIRLPRHSSFDLLIQMINQFLDTLNKMSVQSNLWVVEPHRIRIHETTTDDDKNII